MEQQISFGTPAHKLHKRSGSDTSISAARKVDTSFLEPLVYQAIGSFTNGCIQDQVIDYCFQYRENCPYSSVTARFRSLLDKGLIRDTGERRKGRSGVNQRVLVVSGSAYVSEAGPNLLEFLV